MSWAATAYVKHLRVRPDGKILTKAQKLVLFVLADYHNEDRGDAWASLGHLAYHSMHTRSGLIRVLRTLELHGIISVSRDPQATKTRVTNRYTFPGLTPIASDHRSPGLVTTGHQASDHRSLGVVTTGHHIFPKNLSQESFQKKETRARELFDETGIEEGDSSLRFEEFAKAYPHRGGKRLAQAETKAIFLTFSPEDQALAIRAARVYARDLRAQGIMAKNPNNFLLDPKGNEPWREWIAPSPRSVGRLHFPSPTPEPAPRQGAQRAPPPPPPPPTDHVKRSLWCLTYGHPKEHGFE